MKTEWGEPEAGVQKGMFGGDVEYRPKGNGRKVQIKLDDQLKLANLKASQSQSIEGDVMATYHCGGVELQVTLDDSDDSEYGLYVNARVEGVIFASERLSKSPTLVAIDGATSRVSARTRAYIRRHPNEFPKEEAA